MINKTKLDQLLKGAAEASKETQFVIVGSGALVPFGKQLPGPMTMTDEIDLFGANASDPEGVSDRLDAVGQYSQFHQTHGYFVDGVLPTTAALPSDWRDRARTYTSTAAPGVSLLVPDPNDIALSKIAAWREKDQTWLQEGLKAGLFQLVVIAERLPLVGRYSQEELIRRTLALVKPAPLSPQKIMQCTKDFNAWDPKTKQILRFIFENEQSKGRRSDTAALLSLSEENLLPKALDIIGLSERLKIGAESEDQAFADAVRSIARVKLASPDIETIRKAGASQELIAKLS